MFLEEPLGDFEAKTSQNLQVFCSLQSTSCCRWSAEEEEQEEAEEAGQRRRRRKEREMESSRRALLLLLPSRITNTSCGPHQADCTEARRSDTLALPTEPAWSDLGSVVDAHRIQQLHVPGAAAPTVAMEAQPPHPFPTVDVPDHAHYTIGSVILAIGITGVVGNFLVIYAFSRY
ncbi:hypothetical protein ILYODFUR_017554 [Ilyodon furcidens]|uniref:Uncharacterized protein n=1 Tax=Ilyodon furcidens TaxID=33524 RepID=A0ABV0UHW3_9TELE